MSPRAALQSDIFRTYVFLVASLLAIAGLILTFVKLVLKRQITPIWATYRGWLVMAPLALGCVFAGRVPVIIFFCVLAGLGFKEFARATGLYRDWWLTGAVYLAICVLRLRGHGDKSGFLIHIVNLGEM